jgi:hypothetical protein
MAALARAAGVSAWAAAASAVVVQLLAVATGALVTAALAPEFSHPALVGGAGAIAAACAAMVAWPTGTRWADSLLRRFTGRDYGLKAVRPGPLAVSAAVTTVAWLFYGLALHLSVRGFTGRDGIEPGVAVGVFTGSYVAGLVNVFTSAGLGTRELLLVSWLTGPLGAAQATVVTVGSRLLMTATELVAALVASPFTGTGTDVRHS